MGEHKQDGCKEWYIPALLERWRKGAKSGGLEQLVAMNHPEAVVEPESVDISFLVSFMSGEEEPKASDANELIDKFLALDDFRIVSPAEEESDVEQDWELVDVESKGDAEEDFVSEELADIYLKQGLYAEAKDIYHRLSLQYSEKSVYFADLKRRLESKIADKEGK